MHAGLSSTEAARRLALNGPNVIVEHGRRSMLRVAAGQFTDVLVLVLVGAAIIAAVLGEPQDVIAISAIVLLNAILGFAQEYRAERALEALKAMATPSARVRRDGRDVAIPASDVVVGDLILLEAGNTVPADVSLVEVSGLRVDESTLTGESAPVDKVVSAGDEHAQSTAPADRADMGFKGTTVTYGRAAGQVVATGMATELGKIATLLGAEDERRTPLQRRLARFGRNLAGMVLALCVVIFAAGILRGEPAALMFMTALSLAVAAVPEALPAVVTVTLALGARRMVRQRALIRRLPAVEALGSVTYICSDKTGTLTENRMRVEALALAGQSPDDAVSEDVDRRTRLVEALALNNDARSNGDGELTGDPIETALSSFAEGEGIHREELQSRHPRIDEVPFSSERARMTTLHKDGAEIVAFTKGAPEAILASCDDQIGENGTEPLDREGALRAAESMAASGLRVLAVATRRLSGAPPRPENSESAQSYLGLVGLMDPPREEAADAVGLCQAAGIRVVMITGDHPATARAVAGRLRIASETDGVVTGAQLTAMSDTELLERAADVRVYARVAPSDKIRIVQALQQRGESVAMTGDGVNDAPALRSADIGVAMGRSGTDVAREAAHMVLLDDNFATIVKAVREGRRIYDNIRRFVRYAISTNSGEIWTLFLAPFLGLPLPLLPVHILWMNLVTDGPPGIALVAEPATRDVMSRPPRPTGESVLARGLWQHAVWVGLLMAALALATQAWAIRTGGAPWQTMTFTVLTLSQLAHVLAIRSDHESIVSQGFFTNPALIAGVSIALALQLATIYVPAMNRVFRTDPLTAAQLAACIAIASIVLVAVEIEKMLVRRGKLYGAPSLPDTARH